VGVRLRRRWSGDGAPRSAGLRPAGGWDITELPAALRGVWGLDEQHVYTWGSWRGAFPWFAWDGSRWTPMPDPGFDVRGVHGLTPELVYAVGHAGQVAQWDGSEWRLFGTPTRDILTSVFVAAPDEIYAAGNDGTVLEGSASSWRKLAAIPPASALSGVVKHQDSLLVGGGAQGLFRRGSTSDQFECVEPNLTVNGLDNRGALLVSADECVSSSADGRTFSHAAREYLLKHRAGIPLMQI
jgi:hypothetical protein